MAQIRVSLGFAQASEHQLEETAGEVIDGMTGNAAYPTPPLTMVALQTLLTAFTEAIAAQAQGGPAATALKDQKKDALIAGLRLLANYVQGACNNDLAVLLSSGFEAVSTSRSRSPLEKPEGVEVDNGNTGELILKVPPVKNARTYEVRHATAAAPGVWALGGLFTGARAMRVSGLTPGTLYALQVRAIGGSTGYSDWSDAVSHMSM